MKGNRYGSINKGKKFSIETRNKMSAAHIGRKLSEGTKHKISIARTGTKQSKETCLKISLSNSGKKHYNYGKERTEETKRKISETLKSKPPVSEETRMKLSIAIKKSWAKRKHEVSI